MGEADVVALREGILDLLMARFAGQLLGPELVADANDLVRERFLELDRAGALPILFGDCAALTGYEVAIDHDRSSLGLTPQTEFLPNYRYAPVGTTSENRIALGVSGKFDLWVVKDETRPPTIIARYGDDADDYLSANPQILGLEIVRRIGEPFPEALERLVRLGLLVDDGSLDAFDPDGRWQSPSAKTSGIRQPRLMPLNWRRIFPWWSQKD